MPPLVPIHVKSDHSLGYGTASVEELVERAASLGTPALALTDLENLAGQVRFHHACRERGVSPLTGVELRRDFDGKRSFGSRRGRLVLLARDREGYATLCRAVSRRRVGAVALGEDPVATLVTTGGAGLLAMSDDPEVLRRLLAAGFPPGDLRLLVVRPAAAEREALAAARAAGIAIVADRDVVMLDAADLPLHRLQLAIRLRTTVAEVEARGLGESPDRSFPRPADAELFADLPGAVAEAARLAELCELDLTRAGRVIPASGGARRAAAELEQAAREALEAARRGGRWRGEPYDERLGAELAAVRKLELAELFLLVAEIAREARRRGIEVTGRGSAVGSLLLHVLGVTPVDPLAQGLLFERFLHERRLEAPDIDLDVDSARRDELIDWVYERYGRDRVATVSSIHAFRRRSAWREGLAALGMPGHEVERFARKLPPDDLPDAPVPTALLPDPWRRAAALVERLIGKPRHLAAHPGGLVVVDPPIDERVPLERAAKGVVVTQYDLRAVEEIGLVKIDLLGNRALTEIVDAIRLSCADPRPDLRALCDRGLAAIPLDDPATLELIDRAETIGCFTLESPATRAVLARMPIRGIDDVVAAIAIVRPGAAAGAAKETFLRRARGEEPPELPHPAFAAHPELAARLAETHGVLVYEEDLLWTLHALSGMSFAEADETRAALVRAEDRPEALAALEERFVARAADRGLEPEAARAVWGLIARFAATSFAKAHAWSHALVACQAAFLKRHAPVEFGCALLEHHGGAYPLRTIAAELVRRGVAILPPSVQASELPNTVEPRPAGRAIRIGLDAIRRLSTRSAAGIVESRETGGPFADLRDLLARVALARHEVEALVLAGACDELPPLSPEGYPFAHEAVLERLATDRAGRTLPAGVLLPTPAGPVEPERLETYRALVRVRNELRTLDMHPSDHPMRILRRDAERHGCVTTEQARGRAGEFVRIAGLIAATRRVDTPKGAMQFVTIEDERGVLEAVLFPGVYAALGERITTPGPYLFEGTVRDEGGDLHLLVARLSPFHERHRP